MPARRGEIWWVDFGTPKGSERGGRRPALIIQNDTGNSYSTTTIVAALTRASKGDYPFHVKVSSSETGLSDDGTVLLEQLITISADRLIKRTGVLSQQRMHDVDMALVYSLGLQGGESGLASFLGFRLLVMSGLDYERTERASSFGARSASEASSAISLDRKARAATK